MGESKKDTVSILEKSRECYTTAEDYPVDPAVPNNIMFELTNGCNLRCKMCYNRDMKRKIGFMDEELFRKTIDQAKELGIQNVAMYTVGESLLHPKIFEFIKYAKDKGIDYVYLTTNGIPLDKEKNKKLIESGLDSIKFSIDSASEETYENIRIGASWKKLIDNITHLRDLRDSSGSKLRMFASFLVSKDNYDDLFKYDEIFKDLIDETLFSFIGNQGGHVDVDSMIPKNMADSLTKLMKPKEDWHPCGMLWNRFVVNYDGTMTICCIDFDSELLYGDLNKETLEEVWTNSKMKEFRSIHREHKFDRIPLCFRCDKIKIDSDVLGDLTEEVLKKVKK